MAERPSSRPDLADMRWEPVSGDQTEPTEGKKDSGWANKDKVPYKELNWRWAKQYGYLDWLEKVAIREFDTLANALDPSLMDPLAAPDMFRVHSPADALDARAGVLHNAQGTGGAVNLIDVATDGQIVVYGQGGNVYGVNPDTGAQASGWTNPVTQSPGAQNLSCCTADGRYVYLIWQYSATATHHELWTLDPSDGSKLSSADQVGTANAYACRANGAYLAYTMSNDVVWYTAGDAGVLTYKNNYAHGAAVYGLALDDIYAYIGGDRGTGSFDVRAIKLSNGSALWSVQLPTTAAPSVNAIVTDGDLIYVGIATATATAAWGSGTINLVALNKITGAPVWVSDIGSDISRLAVDDRWLYASNDAGTPACYALDKWTGQRVWLTSTSGHVGYVADGQSIIGTNGATYLKRIARGDGSRLYQRVNGTDVNRRPFFNLAIPVGQGSGQ